jgi:hypothetical protein
MPRRQSYFFGAAAAAVSEDLRAFFCWAVCLLCLAVFFGLLSPKVTLLMPNSHADVRTSATGYRRMIKSIVARPPRPY